MPTKTKKPRPMSDRGQGRKPLPDADRKGVVAVRLTPANRDKLAALGGGVWLSALLDTFPTPTARGGRS